MFFRSSLNVLVAAAITVTCVTTIGCSADEISSSSSGHSEKNDDSTSTTTQTPPSSAETTETVVFRHDAPAVVGKATHDPSLLCNAITPIASSTPIRVRVSDEVAPSLEQADVPNGTYVFIHGDLYTDRPRDNFMLPASTLVVGDRSFEEVLTDANGGVVRTLGKLDSRAGGNVKLFCVAPAPANENELTTDFVSYSKDADELTMERPFENGVLRRVYRRQQ